ncbi:MAG TPA: PPOX class F420-dependent oxidoreductase [Chloroflexota bacterium]|nr:PPOX class F420-dependent oxidoreductase [Chloroflexota bacterium]
MDRSEGIEFLKTHRQAILATIMPDGRPHLTNVLSVYHDGEMWISITETRLKYRNLVRDPRASLLLLGDNFWQYLVVEGRASLTHLPDALPLLREYYEMASGPHPNWEEYDAAMIDDRRVVAALSIDRLYPIAR